MTSQGLFSDAMDLLKNNSRADTHIKVQTLLAISTALLEGIEPIHKKQIDEMFAYLKSKPNVRDTEEAHLTLIKCLVKGGFMEDAFEFTHQMETRTKVPAICFLCITLIKADDLDRAIEVSEMMPLLIAGSTPYRDLAIALAAKERFEEAIVMLNKIPQQQIRKETLNFVLNVNAIYECVKLSSEDKWHACLNISRELMEDGNREEAIALAKIIENKKIMSLALQFICKKMRKGCMDEAIVFANEIPDEQIKSYTLRDLAKYAHKTKPILYFLNQNNQAVNIANTIPDEKIRKRTLLEVS